MNKRIKTNNVPRPLMTYSDMDVSQQARYEKICREDGLCIHDFHGFEYKGHFYNLTDSEWYRGSTQVGEWNASGPHGLTIKFVNGDEAVIVGRWVEA